MSEKLKIDMKKIVPIIILAVIVLFPTPHLRTKQEPYIEYETVSKSDLKTWMDCSRTLESGNSVWWALKDLPDNLRIIVKISSTDAVNVYIKSVQGVVNDKTQKIHDYTIYAKGPSLEVKVYNPWGIFANPPAVMSGDIKIYYDYTTQVPVTKYRTVTYTELLPWWMP